jgi:GAF domain-containing protein
LYKLVVQPFTDKQIELVTTFADQAVIAIENARLFEAEQQRKRQLTESLERQTATSEVLQIISSSPGELQPVFNAMLANATRICEAKFGVLWLCEGDCFRCVAQHNTPPAFAEQYRRQPVVHPAQGTGLRRLFETLQVAQVSDMTTIRPYIERDPFVVASVELGGYRTVVNVPMLKENKLLGAISIYRQEIRPFTDKQIELVQNFAAQAVIAIENARLLNELRQRTDDLSQRTADLTEALEQQTATSEVLGVISGSPGDPEPVFATMLRNAVRICDAMFGNIFRWDGEALHLVAAHNTPPAFEDARRRLPTRPTSHMLRMVETKTVAHVAELPASEDYIAGNEGAVAAVERVYGRFWLFQC